MYGKKINRNIFVMCRNLCLESCFFLFLAWNRAQQLLLLCSHLVWFQISMGLVVSFHIFILGILCSFSWFVNFDLLWSRPCCWFLKVSVLYLVQIGQVEGMQLFQLELLILRLVVKFTKFIEYLLGRIVNIQSHKRFEALGHYQG